MKKSTLLLASILCAGLTRSGVAQPTGGAYEQALAQSKKSIKAKDYPAAETAAQSSLQKAKTLGETGEALIVLGQSFYGRKMVEEARAQWSRAAALDDPEDDGFPMIAHIALATSFKAEKNFDKAIAEYEKVMQGFDSAKVDPEDDPKEKAEAKAVTRLVIAQLHLDARHLVTAREQFDQALKSGSLDPKTTPMALLRLGEIDVLQKNYSLALDEFHQLLKIEGLDPTLKSYAQKQIELLTPLIPVEKEVQDFIADKVKKLKDAAEPDDSVDDITDLILDDDK